jgi:predicted RNA-binding protein with RPS1 domain
MNNTMSMAFVLITLMGMGLIIIGDVAQSHRINQLNDVVTEQQEVIDEYLQGGDR